MSELDWLADVWIAVTSAVTLASIIAKFTPTDWDDELLRRIKRVLDFIAINPKQRNRK